MNRYLIIFILIFSSFAHARMERKGGLTLELGGGYLYDTQVENYDGTVAYYSGLAAQLRFLAPIKHRATIEPGVFLVGDYKFLSNNANAGDTNETARHHGIGLGAYLKSRFLYVNASYHVTRSKHYMTGILGTASEVTFNPFRYEVGIVLNITREMRLGIGYSVTSGTYKSDDTGLPGDSNYIEKALFLNLIYETGGQPERVIKKAF